MGQPPWKLRNDRSLNGISVLARWRFDEVQAGETLEVGKALYDGKRYGRRPPRQPITPAVMDAMTRQALADFLFVVLEECGAGIPLSAACATGYRPTAEEREKLRART